MRQIYTIKNLTAREIVSLLNGDYGIFFGRVAFNYAIMLIASFMLVLFLWNDVPAISISIAFVTIALLLLRFNPLDAKSKLKEHLASLRMKISQNPKKLIDAINSYAHIDETPMGGTIYNSNFRVWESEFESDIPSDSQGISSIFAAAQEIQYTSEVLDALSRLVWRIERNSYWSKKQKDYAESLLQTYKKYSNL